MTLVEVKLPDISEYKDAWLVDRSRLWSGWSHCPRERYLEYHSGPFGYGIKRKSQSLPLVTGGGMHDLQAELLKLAIGAPGIDTSVDAKLLIGEAVAKYRRRCTARGYDPNDVGAEDAARVMDEQSALIEAFGWAAHHNWIPQLLAEWEPVLVEQEILLPVPAVDDPNGVSTPIWAMVKPDLILRRRTDGVAVQVDFKSVADPTYQAWRRQWEDNGQLALQGWAAGEVLGVPVDHAYIYALAKGKREAEKSTGLVKTWNPFLYAYHRRANPPMVDEDWSYRWEWVDEEGNKRRLGKGYERVSIWNHPFELPPGMSPIEFWVRSMPQDELDRRREILGPFQILEHQRAAMLRAAGAEEVRWQRKLWAIHDAGEACSWDERDPRFVQVLDVEAPQTWECHKYGKDCSFLPICKEGKGAQEALDSGMYVPRRPHHDPEIEQMKARGIEPPPEMGDEEEA
jgi:hypothetical protein